MEGNKYFKAAGCQCKDRAGNCACTAKNCCTGSCKKNDKEQGHQSKIAQKGHEKSKFHAKCGDLGCKDHY